MRKQAILYLSYSLKLGNSLKKLNGDQTWPDPSDGQEPGFLHGEQEKYPDIAGILPEVHHHPQLNSCREQHQIGGEKIKAGEAHTKS